MSLNNHLLSQDIYTIVLLLVGVGLSFPVVLSLRRGGAGRDLSIIPLWFVLGLSAILPLFRLLNAPLWYDETFTIAAASGSLSDLIAVVLSDVHTPIHYLLIHLIGGVLGFGQIAVRLPSLVAGVACVYMAYKIARLLYSPALSSWAALLVAVLPATVNFSAEARYPIFLLLAVLVALYLVETKNKYAWIVCAVPAWWHIVALPFSAVLLWRGLRSHFTLLQCVAGGVLSAVFVPLALYQSGDVIDGFWLALRMPVSHITQNFFIHQNALLFVLLPVLGVFLALSWRLSWRWGGLVWCVPAGVWVLSALIAPVYLFRVLLPSVVLLVIAGASLLKWRVSSAVVAVLLMGSLLMYFTGQQKLDMRLVVNACGGSDYIATTSTGLYISMRYHADKPVYSFGVNTRSQHLSDMAKNAIGMMQPPIAGKGCYVMYDNYDTLPIERLYISLSGRRLSSSWSAGWSTDLVVYK